MKTIFSPEWKSWIQTNIDNGHDKDHLFNILIDEDFSYIAKRIGVNCVLNVSNSSKHTSYVDYYNEESASIVAEVYAEDIKMLGYNFDNSNLAKQIKHRSKGEIYSL